MKKFTTTIIIITLAILSTFGQSYSGGSGTSDDPYWISDKTDLNRTTFILFNKQIN